MPQVNVTRLCRRVRASFPSHAVRQILSKCTDYIAGGSRRQADLV